MARAYRDLTPANQYNADYSLLATARIEPLLRRIRNEMDGAGMYVESAKGECNLGQHEIAFRYDDALDTCDNHSIYKTGAKEIAAQEGMSLTFMAKFNEREGNSCHIHLSLRARTATRCMAGDRTDGVLAADGALPRRTARLPAGAHPVLRAERELVQALPTPAASRRPPSPGDATTARARCGSSATAQSLRIENRVPGGDVNPYLAVAALIAAGLHGHRARAAARAGVSPATPTTRDGPRVPTTLRAAADALVAAAPSPEPRSATTSSTTT